MKTQRLILTALLVIGQLYLGASQAMANWQMADKPLQVEESAVVSQKQSSVTSVAEVVCEHHKMSVAMKKSLPSSDDSDVKSAAHDCCDHDQKHAVNSVSTGCPNCGANCVVGISCHHLIILSMLVVGLQAMQIATVSQNAYSSYHLDIRPIYLSQEEIPPKLFHSSLS